MIRDGFPLTAADVNMLERCLLHPESHQDTLASYVPKLLDERDSLLHTLSVIRKALEGKR